MICTKVSEITEFILLFPLGYINHYGTQIKEANTLNVALNCYTVTASSFKYMTESSCF